VEPERHGDFSGQHVVAQLPAELHAPRLRVPRRHWEIYGDPDPSTGQFEVDVFWPLLAP
jgi:hypothetical protein